MRTNFFIALILVVVNINAQNKDFSITLSYPQPIADGTFNSYFGIGDIGISFKVIELNKLQLGIDINGSYYIQNNNFINPTFTQSNKIFLLQPKIYISSNSIEWQKLSPYIAIGYSAAINTTGFNVSNGPPDENEVKGGVNLNIGARVGISKKLFVKGEFDYIEFISNEGGLNLNLSNNFSIIKLGLGYKL